MSSSSYRQSFCFLVRSSELDSAVRALESALALELAHGYLRPIEIDDNVGLLAAVGEGMEGKPGLAGRIFTAISRVHVNIIAIAQGSSELTIAVVVRRDGLENAVRAVHAECGSGPPAASPGVSVWQADRASRQRIKRSEQTPSLARVFVPAGDFGPVLLRFLRRRRIALRIPFPAECAYRFRQAFHRLPAPLAASLLTARRRLRAPILEPYRSPPYIRQSHNAPRVARRQ